MFATKHAEPQVPQAAIQTAQHEPDPSRRERMLAVGLSVGVKAVWLGCMVHAMRSQHRHKNVWATYMFVLPFVGCTSYIASSAQQSWGRRHTQHEAVAPPATMAPTLAPLKAA